MDDDLSSVHGKKKRRGSSRCTTPSERDNFFNELSRPKITPHFTKVRDRLQREFSSHYWIGPRNRALEFDPYHPHYLKQTPISHSIHLITRDLKIKDEKKARELLRQETSMTLGRSISAPVDHPRNGYTLEQHQIRNKMEKFDQKLKRTLQRQMEQSSTIDSSELDYSSDDTLAMDKEMD